MKGTFLYQSEYSQYYCISDSVLPPAEAYRFVPSEHDQRLTSKQNSDRLIYQGGVAYTDWEKSKLQEFDKYLAKKNYKLPVDYEPHNIMRFLHAEKFKYSKAYQSMQANYKWTHSFLPIQITTEIEDSLKFKHIYVAGRDTKFRPIIHLDISRVVDALKAGLTIHGMGCTSIFIIEQTMHYMFLPGQIENYTLVVDLCKKSLTDLPLMACKNMTQMLQENYRGRMSKCLVINITNFTYVLWKMFKVFLSESTRAKIMLFKESYPNEIRESIHPSQYLKKHGGLMEEPEISWPPLVSSSIYTYQESQLMSEDQYVYSLQTNPHLVPRPDLIPQFGNSRIQYLQIAKTLYFNDRVEERTLYGKVISTTYRNKLQIPIKIEENKEPYIKPGLINDENADDDEIMIINPPVYSSQQSHRVEKGYVSIIIEETKKSPEEAKDAIIEHPIEQEIKKPEALEREKAKTELDPKVALNQNVSKPSNSSNKDIASSHADYIIDSKIQSITHPCNSSKKNKMVACKCIIF